MLPLVTRSTVYFITKLAYQCAYVEMKTSSNMDAMDDLLWYGLWRILEPMLEIGSVLDFTLLRL